MSGISFAIEPFRVEMSQAALDAERRQAVSYSISTLLTRNLHDVFGKNDPARRRVAVDDALPSETLNVNESVPVNPGAGV